MPDLEYGHHEFFATPTTPTPPLDPLQWIRGARWDMTGQQPSEARQLCDRTLRLGTLELQIRVWRRPRRA